MTSIGLVVKKIESRRCNELSSQISTLVVVLVYVCFVKGASYSYLYLCNHIIVQFLSRDG